MASIRFVFRSSARTVAVRDNVVALSASEPFPRRMQWRAADGSVVRDFRFP